MAVFDTVEIDGCDVSRATLHNLSFIEGLELMPGNRILVSKRNMIIPQVEENLDRGSFSMEELVPKLCPCCGYQTEIHTTQKRVDGQLKLTKTLFCHNPHCASQNLRKFVHFVSKKAMDIEGLSEATLEQFIARGWLQDFTDIYRLDEHREEIIRMDGFGEKSWQRLWNAIEKSCGIEHDVVDEIAFTMEDLAAEQIKEEQRLEDFRISLRTAVSEYSNTLSEQSLEVIRTRGGIKCATGQKTSRIIGKLCREFGVDGHERYNAVFAQLSDALNPLQMLKTALLSLHPCDFLEMSNKDNTWSSCHNLESGGYQAGALSYMTDDVSMIFFTVDPGPTDHFYRLPRRSRQMFFFKDGSLFQSRLYPQDMSEPMDLYRSTLMYFPTFTVLNGASLHKA